VRKGGLERVRERLGAEITRAIDCGVYLRLRLRGATVQLLLRQCGPMALLQSGRALPHPTGPPLALETATQSRRYTNQTQDQRAAPADRRGHTASVNGSAMYPQIILLGDRSGSERDA
jgi:hypothetical protein